MYVNQNIHICIYRKSKQSYIKCHTRVHNIRRGSYYYYYELLLEEMCLFESILSQTDQ